MLEDTYWNVVVYAS
jgi:hypothetical protein